MRPYLVFSVYFIVLLGSCWTNIANGQATATKETSGDAKVFSKSGIVVKSLAQSDSSWDGTRLPHYPKGQPEITILRITIAPGAELPLHLHTVINAGVLLSGKLTVVTAENKRLYLEAGDPIIELVNKLHFGRNEGNVPAEIIVFYAGVKDKPITIRKSDLKTSGKKENGKQ